MSKVASYGYVCNESSELTDSYVRIGSSELTDKDFKQIPIEGLERISLKEVLNHYSEWKKGNCIYLVKYLYIKISKCIHKFSANGKVELTINIENNDICFQLKKLFEEDGFKCTAKYENVVSYSFNHPELTISWKDAVEYTVDSDKYKHAEAEFNKLKN